MYRSPQRSTLRLTRWLVLSAALLPLGGCDFDTDDEAFYTSIRLSPPVAAGDHFVQVDTSRDEVWVFTPQGTTALDQAVVGIDDDVYRHQVGPDGKVYVLTRDSPALYIVDPESPADPRRFELSTGFDVMSVSPDGRFIITSFAPDSQGTVDSVLFSPNQIAIIDTSLAEAAVREVTLVEAAPLWFQFAPAFTLADPSTEHHFAVAVSEGALSLIDLTTDQPEQLQRIIPLAEPGVGVAPTALDLVFSDDDPADPNDMTLFVLAAPSREVFAIDLLPADPLTGRIVQPAINQIRAGNSPAQMLQFSLDGRDKLLVLDASGSLLTIIDAATRSASNVILPRPVNRGIVWEEVEDEQVVPRALLYSQFDEVVYFAELDAVERQGAGAMRALSLGRTVEFIEAVETTGAQKAIARYTNGNGLDVIDLEQRRTVSIPARVPLSDFVIAGDWLFAVSTTYARLVAVDLLAGTPYEVELDVVGRELAVAAGTVLVRHEHEAGWVSAFGVATFREGAFAESYGYALAGLFDSHAKDGRHDGGAR